MVLQGKKLSRRTVLLPRDVVVHLKADGRVRRVLATAEKLPQRPPGLVQIPDRGISSAVTRRGHRPPPPLRPDHHRSANGSRRPASVTLDTS
jgi:hypothetical protein